MLQLHGRSALVTGGTQGIGAAVAEALAEAGANIVLHGLRTDDAGRQTLARCQASGVRAHLLNADLSLGSPQSAESLLARALELEPRIDLLVNNAGGYFDIPFLELPFETFSKTMHLNVFAPFLLTQRLAQHWVEHRTAGRVLMIGSINGRLAEPTHAAYDVSKGALEQMVRTLCVELGPHGIRVNGVAPGLIDTPLTHGPLKNPRLRAWMELHTPNGQIPGPGAVAPAAVFLLSDEAFHIHGQMLFVDGGMSAWQQPDPPANFT